jgi:hypothetical protein
MDRSSACSRWQCLVWNCESNEANDVCSCVVVVGVVVGAEKLADIWNIETHWRAIYCESDNNASKGANAMTETW